MAVFGRVSITFATVLVLGGCISYDVAVPNFKEKHLVLPKSQFDPAAANFIKVSGGSKLKGNSFLRRKGGEVVLCSGYEVYMWPVTDYSSEVMLYWFGSDTEGHMSANFLTFDPELERSISIQPYYSELDPQFRDYQRTTQCDSSGNFEFSNLSAGEYFVVTRVEWEVSSEYWKEGDYIMKRVILQKGQELAQVFSH